MRPPPLTGQNVSTKVESRSRRAKLVDRHDCTISRLGVICKIVPVRAPPNASNFAPALAAIFTGAPVNAACRRGSRYMRYRRAGEAGRSTAKVTFRGIALSLRFRTHHILLNG